jgi:hypothetical protein
MTIPRRIFQTWKSKTVTNEVLKNWQQSWIENNPSYEYIIWDDNDNRKFVVENFPDFLPVYDGYTKNICRVDAIRYLYLYKYGGIYADLDFECIRSFEPFLQMLDETSMDIALGSLDKPDDDKYSLHTIPNAIMISRQGAPFWEFVIKALQNTIELDLAPEVQTGPVFLQLCVAACSTGKYDKDLMENVYGVDIFGTEQLENAYSKIFIAHPSLLYPISWGNVEKFSNFVSTSVKYTTEELRAKFPDSLAVTYWMHSW